MTNTEKTAIYIAAIILIATTFHASALLLSITYPFFIIGSIWFGFLSLILFLICFAIFFDLFCKFIKKIHDKTL